jgi:hypothetical protein
MATHIMQGFIIQTNCKTYPKPPRCLIQEFNGVIFSSEWRKHYGPGFTRARPNDSGYPSSDTT